MSTKEKPNKIRVFKHGGARIGAGRPAGTGQKTKISVSVNRERWHNALSVSKKKPSQLVDKLLSDYVGHDAA